jgi:rhamnosyl/mannosyltransferase
MARVLHVGKYYAPAPGGSERAVQAAAEAAKAEHDVRVLVASHDGPRSLEVVNGVPVHRAATLATVWSMPVSAQYLRLFSHLAARADLVHFHHPFPLAELAGWLDGCRGRAVVVSYHAEVVRQRAVRPAYRFLQRALFRRADRIVVSSQRMLDRNADFDGVRQKCTVLPYGVPVGDAPPAPPGDFVLFVGRLVAYKGVDVLIRAMREVEAELVVVGDGPLRPALEAMGGRVRFLGHVPDAAVQSWLARCRLLALPSVNNTESFGIVQVEAMAHGRPVVNTDLPTSVPDVSRHDETGLTVPPGDAAALARAIRAILSEPDRYERYSRAARERAKEFSIERHADRMRALYREVLAR